MFSQASGRACFSLLSTLFITLLLTACGGSDRGGDATKSPDLPPDRITAITIDCGNPNPVQLTVGASSSCTAVCDVESVSKTGAVSTTPSSCTSTASWATDCQGLTVSNAAGSNGVITAVSADMCNVTASIKKVASNEERVDVVDVSVDCSFVYPKGSITPEPTPDSTCSNVGALNNDITVPVGVTVPYRAAVRLSDGTLCYAPDAPSGQKACPAGLIQFISGTPAVAAFTDNPPVNGIARTLAVGVTVISGTNSVASNPADLTVINPTLEALCVEFGNPTLGCRPYNTNTVNCATVAPNPKIPVGGNQQFNATAYFDVADNDPNTGFICDVTSDANTTWSISNVGNGAGAAPTVSAAGLVNGGPAATVGALVEATYDQDGNPATANNNVTDDHPFDVDNSLVLGSNSLMVSATTFDPADPQPTRAVCLGGYNLVAGTTSPSNPSVAAEKGFFAVTRKCLATNLSGGACSAGTFVGTTLDDVTDADFVFPPAAQPVHNGHSDEADGVIAWTVEPGYWSGVSAANPGGCTVATDPGSQGAALVATLIGDNSAGMRYTPGAAIDPPQPDSREYAMGVTEDNGQAEAIGASRMQTNCVTATYTATSSNGQQTTTRDGLTVIILPITNDSLLTDPDADGAVALCNTLVPLFNLGADEGGANGAPVQLISAIAAVMNPASSGAGDGGSDDGINQFVTALGDIFNQAEGEGADQLTGPLTDAVEAANAGAFGPLNCAIATSLQAVLVDDPSTLSQVEDCQP